MHPSTSRFIHRTHHSLVWQDGMPIVLNPGKLYRIVSDTLKYEKSVDIATKFIEHGSIRIITVPEGEVGISYDDGVLKVLNAGRHVLDKPTHIFRGAFGCCLRVCLFVICAVYWLSGKFIRVFRSSCVCVNAALYVVFLSTLMPSTLVHARDSTLMRVSS